MFNRRALVALTACLVLTASTAMAGGNGGSKKDSTIRVHNDTGDFGPGTTLYVFVDVPDARILSAAGSGNEQQILQAFNRLGGKLLNVGGEHDFKVKAGSHTVTAVDIEEGVLFDKQLVETEKGETVDVHFESSISSPST